MTRDFCVITRSVVYNEVEQIYTFFNYFNYKNFFLIVFFILYLLNLCFILFNQLIILYILFNAQYTYFYTLPSIAITPVSFTSLYNSLKMYIVHYNVKIIKIYRAFMK